MSFEAIPVPDVSLEAISAPESNITERNGLDERGARVYITPKCY